MFIGDNSMRVDMTQTTRFLSLYDAELEEDTSDEPVHGQYLSPEGSIYSYTNWFYDGDESAFGVM
jgi:hypothetical protein